LRGLGAGGTLVTSPGPPPGEPLVAYSGSGVAPAENDFAAAVSPQAVRADSTYSGSFVDLSADVTPAVAAIAVGASATTLADFDVNVGMLTGSAGAAVRNTSQFDFVANQTVTARIDFTELIALSLADYPPPGPAYATRAATAFTITLTQVGAGGGNILTYLSDHVITGPNATFNSGPTAVSTGTFTLQAGNFYTLDVSQSSTVSVTPVPEPTSMAIFGLMGVGAVVARRRRKNA
jgi:hypothetical protein